jgi:protein-tyrosine phosphatase
MEPELAFVTRDYDVPGLEIRVNFGVFAGRDATPAELDELAHLLVPEVDDVSVVSEQRHEVGEEAEASLHQVRVEIADDHLPDDPAEREELCDRLLDEVTAWAETCIADRHAEVSEI